MNIGLIGFGNLGKAFVSGMLKSGYPDNKIIVTAKSEKTINNAKQLFPKIRVSSEKNEVVKTSDIIILCVDPQNASEVCCELSALNIKNKTLVSFISGISTADLSSRLKINKAETAIIRAMPNIAVSACKGIIGISCEENHTEQIAETIKIFERTGLVLRVRENELEKITVMSACGLAFASTLLDCYKQSADCLITENSDLDKITKELTLQLFQGVIEMVKNKNMDFDELTDMVATKGGATEAGLAAFDKETVTEILQKSMKKSFERTQNMLEYHQNPQNFPLST